LSRPEENIGLTGGPLVKALYLWYTNSSSRSWSRAAFQPSRADRIFSSSAEHIKEPLCEGGPMCAPDLTEDKVEHEAAKAALPLCHTQIPPKHVEISGEEMNYVEWLREAQARNLAHQMD
jgi:hypothetical protein